MTDKMSNYQKALHYEKIEESSLSKVWAYTKKHSCGCVYGWRSELAYREKQENNHKILTVLMDKGYSITKIRGSYIENRGKEDEKKVVSEMAFFVVNLKTEGDDNGQLESDLVKLGTYFNQDSILSIRVGKGFLVGTSKKPEADPSYGQRVEIGTVKYGKILGEYFSQINGRPFACTSEGIEGPCNLMGKYGRHVVSSNIMKDVERYLKELM